VIRLLWEGGLKSHHGRHYTVENARIYTLPDELPPLIVAAAGPKATELAGRVGDGFFGLVPDADVIDQFEEAGGKSKPRYGQIHVCWADDEQEARKTALEWWPNAVVGGNLNWELPLPSHIESASEWADEEAIAESVVCGPDPEPYLEQFRAFADAGYDHVYFHQVGPDQDGFFAFAERELLPELRS
jgi:G6PDH family F420-dependent oxidoreductase